MAASLIRNELYWQRHGSNCNLHPQELPWRVREAVSFKRKIPVYFGFVLSSDTDNLIPFRGTQHTTEWIDSSIALQQDYRVADDKQYYGKTHEGVADAYQQILDLVPPTKLRDTYVHIGQEWAFLSQQRDYLAESCH